MAELQQHLQPQLTPSTEPAACAIVDDVHHGWLSAALNAPAFAIAAPDTREVLPAAVMQQLRYKAQKRGTQPVQQQQQKAPPVHQPCAAMDGEEIDMGACMAALDDQPPTQSPPAGSLACRDGRAAADDRLPAMVTAPKQAMPAPASKVSNGSADAPLTTGLFAKREKRKAEADSKRRGKRAALPDGPGDLSFFMQLRKPGTGSGTASTLQPVPAESGTADSTDSFAGAALGEDSGARKQPQVCKYGHLASREALAYAGLSRHCS